MLTRRSTLALASIAGLATAGAYGPAAAQRDKRLNIMTSLPVRAEP